MVNNFSNLSRLENLSFTSKLTESLATLNQSKGLIVGELATRVGGFISIPFSGLADTVVHAGLTLGKMVTGSFVTPYNLTIAKIKPEWKINQEFELSSALIHLVRVVESVFTTVILPFICLLNPNRAHDFMNHRYGYDKLLNQLETSEAQIRTQAEALANASQEIQTKEEKLIEITNQVDGYKTQMQTLKENLEEVKVELKAKENNFIAVTDQYNKKIDELRKQLMQQSENLKQAQLEKAEQSQQMEELKTELADRDIKIVDLQQENQKLQEQINKPLASYIQDDYSVIGKPSDDNQFFVDSIRLSEIEPPQEVPLDQSIPTQLGEGAVKLVWVKNNDKDHVYYTGKDARAEAELKDEVKIAKSIREQLAEKFPDQKEYYIAVDLIELDSDKGIKLEGERKYTVKTKKLIREILKGFLRKTNVKTCL